MKRRHPVSLPPRQKPMVHALAVALAVAGSAAGAAFPGQKNELVPAENSTPSIGNMTATQKASLYYEWRDSRKSESEKAEIAALVEAWRQRHSAPKSASLSGIKNSEELQGATHIVQNCNDAGAGSLRAAVAGAADTDTIDLSQLACSTITLTTGAISIVQDNLQIVGPGANELEITAAGNSQILAHSGSGTLSIDAVSLVEGTKYSNAGNVYGGCVFSAGSVTLTNAEVRDCLALTTDGDGTAYGGGVFAVNDISVTSSLISGNIAAGKYDGGLPGAHGGGLHAQNGSAGIFDSSITGNTAYSTDLVNTLAATGGGVFAGGGLEAKYSQFTHNDAGEGGGLLVRRDVVIAHSTISDNNGSGAFFIGESLQNPTPTFSMRNSTVSGNDATACAGIRIDDFDQAWISSSTIARNHSETNNILCGSGVGIRQQVNELRLESTIIAENTGAGSPNDLRASNGVVQTVIGANNLIFESSLTLPPDTITNTPPLLGPLAFNGGSTRTHALIEGSPALDTGNNVFNLITDQRGEGFPRVFGPQADIGAFETQGDGPLPDDVIFYNGFGSDGEFGGPGIGPGG